MVTPLSDHEGRPYEYVMKKKKKSRKSNVSLEKLHAMEVTRIAIGDKKLVYAILIPKPHKYQWKRSRVVYIGTTKTGVSRISQSVAAKSDEVLKMHGIRKFTVRIITCKGRKKVKTWVKLERALIFVFRSVYGSIPVCNGQGKKIRESDEFKYFQKKRLEEILFLLE